MGTAKKGKSTLFLQIVFRTLTHTHSHTQTHAVLPELLLLLLLLLSRGGDVLERRFTDVPLFATPNIYILSRGGVERATSKRALTLGSVRASLSDTHTHAVTHVETLLGSVARSAARRQVDPRPLSAKRFGSWSSSSLDGSTCAVERKSGNDMKEGNLPGCQPQP